MSDPVCDALKKKLEAEIDTNSRAVLKGVPDTEYRRLCGVIQGLTTALELVEDLAEKQDIDDE